MRYLTVGDVEAMNMRFVGPDGLANFALLDSAVMRPQQSVMGADAYPDLHYKAAALLHSLARNHAFIDGNKRTALTAVVVFYRLNAWRLDMEQGDAVALAVDVAQGQLDVPAIAGVLKNYAREDPPSPGDT